MANSEIGNKGRDLEESLRAYFWEAGYFVVRGIPYQVEGDDVTDIDLWLYERPAATTRRRIIVDIKNRRSPKAAERVIWVKGLQAALAVDQSIVATTDKRASTRKLAKLLHVVLLDGDAISRITKSEKIKEFKQIRVDELESIVKQIDQARRSSEWRKELEESLGTLLFGFGIQSANRWLRSVGFFVEQAVDAHPGSKQAEIAVRLTYRSAALAALSLDYVLAELNFRQPEERRSSIVSSIRFGQSDFVSAIAPVRAAINLARRYSDNGNAAAKQIEYGFFHDADKLPAEIIADHIMKLSNHDSLFMIAREFESSCLSKILSGYDNLSLNAKSLLGVFIDFNRQSREKIARAWIQESHTLDDNAAKDAPQRQLRLEG